LTAETLMASGLLPEGYSNPSVLKRHFLEARDGGGADVEAWLDRKGGPLADAGLRALEGALQADALDVRLAAAWALGVLGPRAAGAEGPLVAALRTDVAPAVRAAAARALGGQGKGSGRAVAALFEALDDASEAVRHAAAQALSTRKLTPAHVGDLVRALGSADVYVRGFAAWRLGNFREAAKDAVPALGVALALPDTYVAVSAALARIGPAATEAVPALVSDLESPDAGRRWRAARTLGRIGPGAVAAAPALVTALDDPNEGVRRRAARALGRIGPEARAVAAAPLQRATGDRDAGVRREAEEALGRLR
jgi:HEAT repeat protein